MVDFVLQAGCENPISLDLVQLAVEIERQPSSCTFISSEDQVISGLMNACGAFSSSFLARSMVTKRKGSPIWIAASPMPGASYMVSNMSSASLRTDASTFATGLETRRKRLSGMTRISRRLMRGDLITARRAVKCVSAPLPRKRAEESQNPRSLFVRMEARIGLQGRMDSFALIRERLAGLDPLLVVAVIAAICAFILAGIIGVIIMLMARRRRRLEQAAEAERIEAEQNEARMAELRLMQAQ